MVLDNGRIVSNSCVLRINFWQCFRLSLTNLPIFSRGKTVSCFQWSKEAETKRRSISLQASERWVIQFPLLREIDERPYVVPAAWWDLNQVWCNRESRRFSMFPSSHLKFYSPGIAGRESEFYLAWLCTMLTPTEEICLWGLDRSIIPKIYRPISWIATPGVFSAQIYADVYMHQLSPSWEQCDSYTYSRWESSRHVPSARFTKFHLKLAEEKNKRHLEPMDSIAQTSS